MATREQLKSYFKTGDYPTQGQFATLIDAIFIKAANDIGISDVSGLSEALAGKGSAVTVQQAYEMALQALTMAGHKEVILPNDERIENTGAFVWVLNWSNELSQQFGVEEANCRVLFSLNDSTGRYQEQTAIQPIYSYGDNGAVATIAFEINIDIPFKIIITK